MRIDQKLAVHTQNFQFLAVGANLARSRDCHPLALGEGSYEADRWACLTRRDGSDDAVPIMLIRIVDDALEAADFDACSLPGNKFAGMRRGRCQTSAAKAMYLCIVLLHIGKFRQMRDADLTLEARHQMRTVLL